MTWKLSRFSTGELVEVRSKNEILATLDENGCLEDMQFMPEMLKFCGQRFKVRAVAHKTCDPVRTLQGQRLQTTVHLNDLRCDGSSHGGCEAACALFWKDQWLKSVNNDVLTSDVINNSRLDGFVYTEKQLLANTKSQINTIEEEPCYSCQATKLRHATKPLPWWDLRQYVFDITTGNHSLIHVLKVVFLGSLRSLVNFFKRGYKYSNWIHLLVSGRESPSILGKIKSGDRTPEGRLNLKPGELVRIKSKNEIEETLNDKGLNRGLYFGEDEMLSYCGGIFRVQSIVTKILDESTGKMLYMKQPCIILEGVVCKAEYSSCRLNCPRAIPCYWHELWLERVL